MSSTSLTKRKAVEPTGFEPVAKAPNLTSTGLVENPVDSPSTADCPRERNEALEKWLLSASQLRNILPMTFLRLAGICPANVVTAEADLFAVAEVAILVSELKEYELSRESCSALSSLSSKSCHESRKGVFKALRELVMKVASRYKSHSRVDFFVHTSLKELEELVKLKEA